MPKTCSGSPRENLGQVRCAEQHCWGIREKILSKFQCARVVMVVNEQAPAVLLKYIYIEPKDGLTSGLDEQWDCLEKHSQGWLLSWALLTIPVFPQREVGTWHRAWKANQLINSMRGYGIACLGRDEDVTCGCRCFCCW